MSNYRGKKCCASCGVDAKSRYWVSEKRAICHICDYEMSVGRDAIKKASEGDECSISVGLAAYTPGVYSFQGDYTFGVDTSTRKNRADTKHPPYVSEAAGVYDSRKLNTAINEFLSSLEDGAPIKQKGNIYCKDGTFFYKSANLRNTHAIAWVKFYDEFSQFCEGLVEVGEQRGKSFLNALMKKEVDLYHG